MGPTGSTVLRQVLVEGMGQVGYSVDVGPREGIGEGRWFDVCVREGGLDVFFLFVIFMDLKEKTRRS